MAQLLDTEINGNLNVSGQLQIGNTNVDYIVEQGSSGIWTYRKWNSGIAECWGTKEGSLDTATAWGSLFYGTLTAENFPTNLFTTSPFTLVEITNDGCWITRTASSETATGTISVISASKSSSRNYKLEILAKGKWK